MKTKYYKGLVMALLLVTSLSTEARANTREMDWTKANLGQKMDHKSVKYLPSNLYTVEKMYKQDVSIDYDNKCCIKKIQFNNSGNNSMNYIINFTYDDMGRISQTLKELNGRKFITLFKYTTDGTIEELTYKSVDTTVAPVNKVVYKLDKHGNLQNVVRGNLITKYLYDSKGNVSGKEQSYLNEKSKIAVLSEAYAYNTYKGIFSDVNIPTWYLTESEDILETMYSNLSQTFANNPSITNQQMVGMDNHPIRMDKSSYELNKEGYPVTKKSVYMDNTERIITTQIRYTKVELRD